MRVLPTGRRDRNRGGNHGSWNSALPVGSPHSDHHPSRPLAALDSRGVLRDIVQLVLFDARLAMWRRTSIHCFAFANRATVAQPHVIATALLQLVLLEPTRAADGKPDECGLASVYSTLSEETASGQDTSVNDRTAAHRSLPFGTLVRVYNQENGRSAVVRITDRGPFVSGRIIDVSQVAAYELGFEDLMKVCLKILSIPEKRPIDEQGYPSQIDDADRGHGAYSSLAAPRRGDRMGFATWPYPLATSPCPQRSLPSSCFLRRSNEDDPAAPCPAASAPIYKFPSHR